MSIYLFLTSLFPVPFIFSYDVYVCHKIYAARCSLFFLLISFLFFSTSCNYFIFIRPVMFLILNFHLLIFCFPFFPLNLNNINLQPDRNPEEIIAPYERIHKVQEVAILFFINSIIPNINFMYLQTGSTCCH